MESINSVILYYYVGDGIYDAIHKNGQIENFLTHYTWNRLTIYANNNGHPELIETKKKEDVGG